LAQAEGKSAVRRVGEMNRLQPGKHRLFSDPKKRGVAFIAGLAAA